MSTFRGRPPCMFCVADGIIGSKIAHCSSVRSEGYFFLPCPFCTICAHSYADGICANYLINLLFCQVMFPDSLSVRAVNHDGSVRLLTPTYSMSFSGSQPMRISVSRRVRRSPYLRSGGD